MDPSIKLYEPHFNKFETKDASDNSIEIRGWTTPNNLNVLQLQFSPKNVDRAELNKQINFIFAQQIVTLFAEVTDAWVKLNVRYDIAANFAQHYFVEKKCTIKDTCLHLPGLPPLCGKHQECEDIPRLEQSLANSQFNSYFHFESGNPGRIPSDKFVELENKLLSRLMNSLYLEDSRLEMPDMVQVTFGQLKKHEEDEYSDYASIRHFDKSSFEMPIKIQGINSFMDPILNAYYAHFLSSRQLSK
jgi:hypothetical protein